MRAGRLRHRASLQEKSETADDGGGVAVSWTEVRKIRCDIVPVSGVQRMESMRRNSQISHEITIRHDDAVTAQQRLVHDGMEYRIEAVVPDRTKRRMTLVAAQGVAT